MIKNYNQSIKYDPTMPIVVPQRNVANVAPIQVQAGNSNNQQVQQVATSPYNQIDTIQYQNLSAVYSSFDTGISKYSPFYGKMGNTETTESNNTKPATVAEADNATANTQTATTAPVSQKIEAPSGPVLQDIQEKLQEEVGKIQSPQQAIQTIASHAMLARQDRTITNNVSWGARYYAKKALEMTEQLGKNKENLNPSQIQSQLTQIETLKVKSIGILNDAKKKAISTYNEALKATLLYNHFFTDNGQYASSINDNDRKFVVDELNKTWTRWTGGFEREWQGQMAHADEAPIIIDKASQEANDYLQKIDQSLKTIK